MENTRQEPDDSEERAEPGPESPETSLGSEGYLPPEEQPTPPGPREREPDGGSHRGGKRMAIIAALVGIVGLVAIVVVGVFSGIVPIPGFVWGALTGAKAPEHSASYYPDDTLAYAWITLAPGNGQFENSRDIWERLIDIPEFEDLYDQLGEDFEDDTGIDFDDLREWAGPDMSFAMSPGDRGDVPRFALSLGVRDNGAAEDFIDDLLDYLENEEGQDFDSDSYEGYDIWVSEYDDAAFGLSGDLLVLASNEDFLEEVIDGANGDIGDSLADDDYFQEARAALPENRFASVFFGLDTFLEDNASDVGLEEALETGLLPEWVAISSGWGDRAVFLEIVMPSTVEHQLEIPSLESPADALPEDTLLLLSLAFDPNLDNWRDTLGEYEIAEVLGEDIASDVDGAADELESMLGSGDLPEPGERPGFDYFIDLAVAAIDEAIGVDLEEEFFDHLEGNISLAVWDIAFDEYGDIDDDEPFSLVTMLSYRSSGENILADTMEELEEFVEDEGGIDFDSVDVGGDRDAQIMDVDDDYTPGYVLNDGYLVFGSTEESLQDTVELQQGAGDNLNSNPEYRRALALLPDDKHFLAFVNLNELIRQSDPEAFESGFDFLPTGDISEDVDQQEIWEASVGAAAASYTLGHQGGDGLVHYNIVLTLFPE